MPSLKKKTKEKKVTAPILVDKIQVSILYRSSNHSTSIKVLKDEMPISPGRILMNKLDMRSLNVKINEFVLIHDQKGENSIMLKVWPSIKVDNNSAILHRSWSTISMNYITVSNSSGSTPNKSPEKRAKFFITKVPATMVLHTASKVVLGVVDTTPSNIPDNVNHNNSSQLNLKNDTMFFELCRMHIRGQVISSGNSFLLSYRGNSTVIKVLQIHHIFDNLESHQGYTWLLVGDETDLDFTSLVGPSGSNGKLDNRQDEVKISFDSDRINFGGYATEIQTCYAFLYPNTGFQSSSNSNSNMITSTAAGLGSSGSSGSGLITGVLFYGPHGTGKSRLIRELSNVMHRSVFTLNIDTSSEQMSMEAQLLETFKLAKMHAPSVILIDDIETYFPQRREASNFYRRLVSSFLSIVDGYHTDEVLTSKGNSSISYEQHNIILFATTTAPDAIDAALRRPGRLDLEIELGVPRRHDRKEIIRVIMQDLNITFPLALSDHTNNINAQQYLEEMADLSHGMVASDLLTACKLAIAHSCEKNKRHPSTTTSNDIANTGVEVDEMVSALSGLQLKDTSTKSTNNIIVYKDLCCQIDIDYFKSALACIVPSGIRELSVEVPTVRWKDIGGMSDVKDSLKELVEWPLMYPEVFYQLNITPPAGVLLYGPPGCSKTLMAKALATESSMNFIAIRGPELLSKWLGESEKSVQNIFKRARAVSPCIVFFDEIDALAGKRGETGSGVSDRILSQLLTELDGAGTGSRLINRSNSDGESLEQSKANAKDSIMNHVLVVAATNRPDTLDTALLRPGRIDRKIYVSPPDHDSRLDILELRTRKIPTDESVTKEFLLEIVKTTEGYSGAELVSLCEEAAILAIEDGRETLAKEHLLSAQANITPQITPQMKAFYETYAAKTNNYLFK